MSQKVMQQALEALESDHPDIQLRAAIALRAALAEPEQEPDGISWLKRDSGYFTAPTPRKPLTDEEIVRICVECWRVSPRDIFFARAIERAHGITGETK